MKTIQLGFSTHKKFALFSWLIKKVLNRQFSHSYFKFQENYSDKTVFHAVGKGLIYISETTFIEQNTTIKEFDLSISDELFLELMEDCHKNAGKDYGFLQNLGIAIIRGLAKLGIIINKNPINDGINCSEWLYYILEEIYGKWIDKDPNLVAPDDVFDFLEEKLKSN